MKRFIAILCTFSLLSATFTGCTKKENPNETTKATESGGGNAQETKPLVVEVSSLGQKFSPFFAENVPDEDVYTKTQTMLLTTDRTGGIVYNAIEGETIPYNGKDYTYKGIANVKVTIDEKSNLTTYYAKIRDDVKFSDGHVMDADDIIFNFYVYFDPSYTGANPIFSKPIVGLQNYKSNSALAETFTPADITKAFEVQDVKLKINEEIIKPALTEELEWVKGLYGNPDYASYTEEFPVAKDLFNNFYGTAVGYDSSKTEDEAAVLSDIIALYDGNFELLGELYAGDKSHYVSQANNIAISYLSEQAGSVSNGDITKIEGIKKLSQTEIEVVTRGYDASAIYSIFGIPIAPMHYYGDEKLYDYENDKFGFVKGDLSTVESKTNTPMGAGPYKFTKFENKVVYYEANPHYYKGEPKTKYLQLKETKEPEKISGVGTGVLDIANPAGSIAGYKEISSYNSNGETTGDKITLDAVDNAGYGYVGINANKINVGGNPGSDESKNLRKAIATMLAVYRDLTIDSYYGEVAKVINYPISATSWAAPQKTDPDYRAAYSIDVDGNPIFTSDMNADQKYEAATKAAIGFFKAAGYTFDEASGKLTAAPEGARLEYEVLIPADGSGDHPTFGLLANASEALSKIGFNLVVTDLTDGAVLWEKLDVNDVELWAAAWQATIDPDIYQVYHSSNIPGLPGSTGSNNYAITDENLDKKIVEARESADQNYRKIMYKEAFDIILDWGVEVPVYQRQNCVLFSTERINIDTVTPDITTFYKWTEEIEKIEMR